MGKKKNYSKIFKGKFSGPTNPFHLMALKRNKQNNSSIKKEVPLPKKSNFLDRRATSVFSTDKVTERYLKNNRKGGKQNFSLSDRPQAANENSIENNAFSHCEKLPFLKGNWGETFPSGNFNEPIDIDLEPESKKQKVFRKDDVYSYSLKQVDAEWKKLRFPANKKTFKVYHSEAKDRYDLAKSELMLDIEKRGVSSCSQVSANPTLKVLLDLKDFQLDNILANATNPEYIKQLLEDLHFLATKDNLNTANKIRDILREEYDIFSVSKKKNLKKNFPRPQAATLLNIIGTVYSTTELHHAVLSPAIVMIADILGTKFFCSYDNIVSRLFVTNTALNYIAKSKKFFPEALMFLKTVLKLSMPEARKSENASHPKFFDLILHEKASWEEIPTLMLYPKDKTLTLEQKKIATIFTIVNQISQFAVLYKDYEMFKVIFEPFSALLTKLPVHLYPTAVEDLVKKLIEYLNRETPPLRSLTFKPSKPKPLVMFEPSFKCKYQSIEDFERKNPPFRKKRKTKGSL